VLDERVMAGNGVIGLELAEELDGIDAVLVPWGGGGLTTGIASALAAVSPSTRVIACEPETGAPAHGRRSPQASRSASTTAVVRRRRRLEGAPAGDVGASAVARRRRGARAARARRERSPAARDTRPRRRRGAGALALAAALAGHGGRDGSCASSREATSTPTAWRRSSRATSLAELEA
jgi:threonine dehydratase